MAEKSRGKQHGARSKLSSNPREKLTVNEVLKEFEEGEKARIQLNPAVTEGRPHQRVHGKTGEVKGKRGDSYEVEIKDGNVTKTLFLKPAHLKKVE